MKRKATERATIESLDLSIVKPCRASLRDDVIERYREMVENDPEGWPFDTKVAVAEIPGAERRVVIDGQHRIEACKRAGVETVIVDLYAAENLDEAIRYARAANAKHGERLSREELRENVLEYLRAGGDKESDTAIAETFGVSRNTVAEWRKVYTIPSRKAAIRAAVDKAIQENPQASVRELAKAAGASKSTVDRETAGVSQNAQTVHFGTPSAPQVAESCRELPQVAASPVPPPRRDEQPPQRRAETPPPRRALKPVEPPPQHAQEPKPIYDEVGHEMPPDLYEAWFAERKAVDDWLARARAILREVKAATGIEEEPGFASLRFLQFTHAITSSLEVTISALKDVRPEALCTCKGYGCKRCHDRGWMSVRQYRTIIPEDQQ